MSAELTAVLGVGQTKYSSTRGDVSIAGLCREAAYRALEDACLDWKEIDAVVIGKAPDFFEGVMMPELYLAEALGAVGKPILRVHTAGSVGGSTALVAASLIQSRVHEKVLTIGFEKQSESILTIPVNQHLTENEINSLLQKNGFNRITTKKKAFGSVILLNALKSG